MSLIRRTRYPEFMTLRAAMDSMFDDALLPGHPRANASTTGFVPFDVIEREDEIVVRAPVPGFKTEDIDITVQGDVLTVSGTLREDAEASDENGAYHLREWRSAAFRRAMTLPEQVNADGAEARVEDGVLTLTLPKREDVKPRKIEVLSS